MRASLFVLPARGNLGPAVPLTVGVGEAFGVREKPKAVILGEGEVKAFGLSPAERLRRGLRRAGLGEPAEAEAMPTEGTVLLLRGDHVYDEILLARLAGAEGPITLTRDDGVPVAMLVGAGDAEGAAACLTGGNHSGAMPEMVRQTPGSLAGSYNETLRKRESPYLLPATAETATNVERRIFDASYKGATDLVTKYLWPRPALTVTRWLAGRCVRPNAVTTAGAALMLAALWLFANGLFLAGLLAAWMMTFLDTVDGKLARVTLTSSRFGNIFDHGMDLIHPPFWYWAWFEGCARLGAAVADGEIVLLVVIGGYVLQRLQEGLFIAKFGIEMHIWRPFDSLFRLITARRNPNLLILTASAVAGLPEWGLTGVAAWTAVSLSLHGVRLAQAFLALHSRRPVVSWLAE